jgi:hypothetical protein
MKNHTEGARCYGDLDHDRREVWAVAGSSTMELISSGENPDRHWTIWKVFCLLTRMASKAMRQRVSSNVQLVLMCQVGLGKIDNR